MVRRGVLNSQSHDFQDLAIVVTRIAHCCEIALVHVPSSANRLRCEHNCDLGLRVACGGIQISQKVIRRDVRETLTNVTVSKTNDFVTFRSDFLDKSIHRPGSKRGFTLVPPICDSWMLVIWQLRSIPSSSNRFDQKQACFHLPLLNIDFGPFVLKSCRLGSHDLKIGIHAVFVPF